MIQTVKQKPEAEDGGGPPPPRRRRVRSPGRRGPRSLAAARVWHNPDGGEPLRQGLLRDVKTGETVKVIKLHGEGAIRRRIMDMGVTKGTEVFVRKVAPLGDPIELTVRGYELSIRKSDAVNIKIE